ncbi:hypothetical protein A2866_03465 [Candidatus Roizmanbacteria bacterium RIFCSPHIGHO2_01_FULL_39_8]|uniref:Methyltransferase domain-containing protein n=3 Tax=Candidatus Roizmaniibacteriota TaxID=1752723 RepID=A0A1F7GSY4_9BACT|nr:MAG: hypothetical protein A2866_03465 [Candidatus Roizmanbacteria bacterium RIFCSPHIGHO2_01_FULL_39_8]OGK28097.1 MAG: hypothetical protein A3C28_03220 [Candidatus Roizmanbacteria bacterium RIFCSPHIGHO2_02_FULL_39_9]OGK34968.1 MAG: hypothetical protein A3F60_04840 [Candidatus Roizmanbacteria bacterium RIFCSPHIGHO2_12_FULL_39_8]
MKHHSTNPFDSDVSLNGGYLYTTNALLSSRLANERLTRATIDMMRLKGKRVIDVGCGDGSYTIDLYKKYKPEYTLGFDASRNAINLAKVLYKKNKNIYFEKGNIYNIPKRFGNFDIAIIRGVLHHLDSPQKAIQSVAKVASHIIILEPNGYNPLLKIIEKVSLYHRIHKEKSYFPLLIRTWVKKAGFRVIEDDFVGLVPFFCPDGMATTLKKVEPFVEGFPYVRNFLCGVYVLHAKK